MSDFAEMAQAASRSALREAFEAVEDLARHYTPTLALAQHVELSVALAEVRRLLFGGEAPPTSGEVPSNVRRLVAVAGTKGPVFGARAGIEMLVGRGGLRMPERDLMDIGAKFDSQPKPTSAAQNGEEQ